MLRRITKGLQYVVFRIGKELFGLGIDAIREIVRHSAATEVPDAPAFLEGMINLRGRIVPIIDLRTRLKLPAGEKTKSTRVLIAEHGDSIVGLIVDSVEEVIRIQPEDIDTPPDMISAIGIEYITGVVKSQERLIILLDLRKILDATDMKSLEPVVAAAEPRAS